jgi:hypothetical protein
MRSHNEEKPFQCKWPGCGKGFKRAHDCKRHEQLHFNYRPHKCEGCGKSYQRRDALNRHSKGFIRLFSRPPTNDPPVCSEGGQECLKAQELQASAADFVGPSTEKSVGSVAAYYFLASPPFPPSHRSPDQDMMRSAMPRTMDFQAQVRGTQQLRRPSAIIPSPSLEYPRKTWWDNLLDSYAPSRAQAYVPPPKF